MLRTSGESLKEIACFLINLQISGDVEDDLKGTNKKIFGILEHIQLLIKLLDYFNEILRKWLKKFSNFNVKVKLDAFPLFWFFVLFMK